MDNKDTGLLLNKNDIILHRAWFKQMTALHGVNLLYRAPRNSKQYDAHGELDTLYCEPIIVPCLYDEHPTQQTMKRLGWNAELGDKIIITVAYDVPDLQVGALFEVPSALDNTKARVFKVLKMSNIAIYPCTITCELGPVLESEFETSQLHDFSKTDFNLLNEEED